MFVYLSRKGNYTPSDMKASSDL